MIVTEFLADCHAAELLRGCYGAAIVSGPSDGLSVSIGWRCLWCRGQSIADVHIMLFKV